ncbi:Isoleucine--tRNA ligase, cytoplasmic [Trichinella nelsoni]|uniref:Isoleucine--tRNA ligase, cytoplasmic n=1 Tax=Trichinella nelsoni TaxID=6336 RepID=A0A0V0S5A9_9BILA|nr:Isoleucine--tRNA ligase, cytoplasmic [Trichinella nelsoni]
METLHESINFPLEEEKILQLWKKIDAFKTCQERSKGRPIFSFYDGPPFATGLPHYGHILAGTIKDTITRFAYQSGFQVERRFGWDCHGLPVEYEIDKTLGLAGPQEIEKFGVSKYNAECRAIVMRYAKEWQCIVERLGRWIDFKNDYKTLYPSFMESVWWVFKQLYNKGLVYRGVKVMPFSTACGTPLSNFESGQNYKEVIDPAIIVTFPLDEDPSVSLLAWTTTPWTLPSNLALCVNANLDYVKIRERSSNRIFILMEARLNILYKSEEEYEIVERFHGQSLEGKKYKPLFEYFTHLKMECKAFSILCDGYVSAESGTGVVHQAPYFGEDDYRVCLFNHVITKEMNPVCPVDSSGRFTKEVTDFHGQYVKDADKGIIKMLKANGRLIQSSTVKHSYPFCWRSDTPLIYKAVPSWFVKVEFMVEQLLANNEKTYWVPSFVKEKRFANWLQDARDWAISRNRFWGTPIPLWVSDDGEEVVCVGSIEELQNLTGKKLEDLHREYVDVLTIESVTGRGILRRIPEVFDCWFESGSMPYAQKHFPFENYGEFLRSFPADFIAEGIDQTRGWFYTLLVLSTALFGKPPFKNLIVNGLVLAADGSKMSKRKKNYPDPMDIVNKYGADVLRLYLINSPVVRGEFLKFREEGVRDLLKDVFLPWYNAYRFFFQNVSLYEMKHGKRFTAKLITPTNIMDRWILSFTYNLVAFVKEEMKAYRLYTVVPRLVKYVNMLTNWYVRMNRKRLKGDFGEEESLIALETLCQALLLLVRLMASFTPFITEMMWQRLKTVLDPLAELKPEDSIHYVKIPDVDRSMIDEDVENHVITMQSVVEVARVIRDRHALPTKYPIKEVVLVHHDLRVLDMAQNMRNYILDEVNARSMMVSVDKAKWGIRSAVDVNLKLLGARLKKDLKPVMDALKAISADDICSMMELGPINILGYEIFREELQIKYVLGDTDVKDYQAHSDGRLIVLLNVSRDESMHEEGLAREMVNRIQKLRKKAKLLPQNDVMIKCELVSGGDSSKVYSSLCRWREFMEQSLKQPIVFLESPQTESDHLLIIKENVTVKGCVICVCIFSRSAKASQQSSQLFCPYVDVVDSSGRCVRILLENPIRTTFCLWNESSITLYKDKLFQQLLVPTDDTKQLNSTTIYVRAASSSHLPVVTWINVLIDTTCKACLTLLNPNQSVTVGLLKAKLKEFFPFLNAHNIEILDASSKIYKDDTALDVSSIVEQPLLVKCC